MAGTESPRPRMRKRRATETVAFRMTPAQKERFKAARLASGHRTTIAWIEALIAGQPRVSHTTVQEILRGVDTHMTDLRQLLEALDVTSNSERAALKKRLWHWPVTFTERVFKRLVP